ncbi:transketolase [Trichlorobacter thiogenes]|uniref:Transketolase n=1 Tax=Trichlorobacter thiogenes TaxID=115783 RepID=A0A1T4JWN0_9BACT|nr:transketolase C-terminal domain-containing protein [Trichlorobacter thiogenes]SJZ34662.1 transketolase [Trichlorobacter thiogenes]
MKIYEDARDAIFEELYELALKDKDVIVLSADTGAYMLTLFKKNIPEQFYNVGIAEQNMMSVAAGLSMSGKKVFVYGISNFVTLRCLEQIKIDICCMQRPVTIIGMGTGYVYSSDGPTHHITEDVAVMRAIPGITILSPSDCSLCAASIHIAYNSQGPCYIRFDKGPFDQIYQPDTDFSSGVSEITAGIDYAIIATGIMVNQAQFIAKECEKRGIAIAVIDLYRLKPVNTKGLVEMLRKFKGVFTLEEHTIIGGIGSIIAETLVTNNIMIPVKMFGIPDVSRRDVGSREFMRRLDGTDVDTVVSEIMSAIDHAV